MAARIRHPGALGASWRHLSQAGCRGGGIASKVGSGAPWRSSVADEGAGLNQRKGFLLLSSSPSLCLCFCMSLSFFLSLCLCLTLCLCPFFCFSLWSLFSSLSLSSRGISVSLTFSVSVFPWSLSLFLGISISHSAFSSSSPLVSVCLSLTHTCAHLPSCPLHPPLFLLLHLHDHNVTLSVVWAPNMEEESSEPLGSVLRRWKGTFYRKDVSWVQLSESRAQDRGSGQGIDRECSQERPQGTASQNWLHIIITWGGFKKSDGQVSLLTPRGVSSFRTSGPRKIVEVE